MKKKLVLTVGNSMMGDDAAGPLLAQAMQRAPLEDWEILDGGFAPENCLHLIRALAPEQILIVDAADMDLQPGEVRLIDVDHLEEPFLMTTHTLSLFYLVQSLGDWAPQVDLLGIQPELVAFGFPLSPAVRQAVARVYEDLKQANLAWDRLETTVEAQPGKDYETDPVARRS